MALMDTLKDKADEHNEEVGDVASKRTTAGTLKKVYDRGIGAYRTNPSSVRPSVTSASQWAFGRVNSFLYALRNGKFRSGKHDTDLLPKGHPMSSKKAEQVKQPQLAYFRTEEEAEEYADFLGCRGTHRHEGPDGEPYFMACSTHERNVELEEMRQGKMQSFKYKGIPAEVKDIDRKQGIVTGYFAQFGNVDSDMDVIKPGAFTKTIAENGPMGKNRIMHLYQHDINKPLGKPYEVKEDSFGLYFESQIIGTSYGEDVLKLYEAGVINEHSIGFKTVKSTPKEGFNEIEEVMLYEGSTVTFGANENTPFTGFKSMTATEAVQKMQTISKAFRRGDFTDDTFNLLEIQMKQLEQFIIDQYSQEKAEPSTDTSAELLPSEIDEAFNKLQIKLL
jgi:HK97 family phage prohead protease